MSSSSHRVTRLALAVGATCSLGVSATAQAGQTYVQPQAVVRAETDSNLTLDPAGSPEGTTEGYIADLQVLVGYATPTSETSIRPRVRFQNYPDYDQREKVEGFLDWVTRFRWERSLFDIIANYSQQDSYNYDTRSGEFDPLDPNNPTVAGSGKSLTGETRTEAVVRPSYSYDLTERLSVGVGGQYQITNYDASEGPSNRVDYDFWVVNANLGWSLDERSIVGIVGYLSQYEPKNIDGHTDGYGAGVTYDYKWSEVLGFEATVGYEVNDPKYSELGQEEQKSSSVGGSIAAFGESEASKWRFLVRQRYAPNGDGGMRQMDEVRFQYDRDFTRRLSFLGSARYESQRQLTGQIGEDRDTARLDVGLKWLVAPTWFVQGGYAYIWQKEGNQGNADNNRFYLGAGYKGLGRQR